MKSNLREVGKAPVQGPEKRRDGAVLAAVMILVLLLGILAVTVMKVGEYVGVEVSRDVQGGSAFWRAEAGLQHARALLRTSQAYRSASVSSISSLTNGYAAVIQAVSGSWYTVTSTGTSHSAVRIVRQELEVTKNRPDAFNYALFSGGGQMWLRKDTTVEGVGEFDGDLYSEGGYKFNGAVLMQDGSIYDGDSASLYPEPVPKPVFPALTNLYEQLVLTANTGTTVQPTFTLNLSGGTNRYNLANLAITGTINGPGTLVVKGNINISAGVTIGNDVCIVSGGVIGMSKTFTVGSNCVFYATTGIDLAKDGDMSLGQCALITPGDISAKKSLIFTGLMYAGGDIACDMDADITGCAVCGGAMTMKMGLQVLYDVSQFEQFLPGMFGENIISIRNGLWSEITP
jgi:hypothetical protein